MTTLIPPTPAPNLTTPVATRNDPATFAARADVNMTELPPMTTGLNALGANVYNNATYTYEQATLAAASQAAAAASQAAATESATLSQSWATSLGVVDAGLYGARYYANQAIAAVATLPAGTINDLMIATDKTWSSTKLNADFSAKQGTLVSGVNIKTVNGQSVIGSGDLTTTLPTGGVTLYYGTSFAGHLSCNGAVYLQSSYSALYAMIGLLPNKFIKVVNSNVSGPTLYALTGPMSVASANMVQGYGSTGYAYSSNSGQSWTSHTGYTYCYSTACNTTHFLLVTYSGGIYTLRRFAWTAQQTELGTVNPATTHNSTSYPPFLTQTATTFILFDNPTVGTTSYKTSTDGVAWTTRAYPAGTIGNLPVATYQGNVIRYDVQSGRCYIRTSSGLWYTTDGIAFSQFNEPPTSVGRSGNYWPYHYENNAKILAFASTAGKLVFSSGDNGTTWGVMGRIPADFSVATANGESALAVLPRGFFFTERDTATRKAFFTTDFVNYQEVVQQSGTAPDYPTSMTYVVGQGQVMAAPVNMVSLSYSPYAYDTTTQFITPVITNGWIKT